jgi:urease accessory protein
MMATYLLRTLQIVDSLFPVGAFAYSDGLESAAAGGRVQDAASLAGWLHHVLYGVFAPCEGLALLKCMRAMEKKDWAKVREIDEELTALKPASATRAASKSVGKSLISTYASIVEDGSFARVPAGPEQCNAPVAYAAVFHHRGIDCSQALLAFGYARLAAVVSAGLRLAAIGQQQGQAVLARALDRLPEVTEHILANEAEPLRSFSPLMDIQQMNHRYLYSRLYRS